MKCENCGAEINSNNCKYCGKVYKKQVVKDLPFQDTEERIFLKVSGSMNDVKIKYDEKSSDNRDKIKVSGSMNTETIYTNRVVDIKLSGSMNTIRISKNVKYCVIKKSGSMNDIKIIK